MESDTPTLMLGIVVGGAILVLLGPPLLLSAWRKLRHRRGRRRSAHRSRH